MTHRLFRLLTLVLLAALAIPVAAQDAMADVTPSVSVSDQFVTDSVFIENVDSQGPGFIVIHIDNNGAPGPVAGFAPVAPGQNPGVWVELDTSVATPVLYAMLHTDDTTVGEYEFGTVEGADAPVAVDGQVITPAFNVAIIDSLPQVVADNTVTVESVTIPVDGFLVIHSEAGGGPGPVLGQTAVSAGTTTDVTVTLSDAATSNLWPMLHVDDNTIGEYEFGAVEGADSPVRVGGRVATTPFSTVPTIIADDQVILPGGGTEMMEGVTPTVRASAVLSTGPGFLVIHADADGAPGPVLGQTAVADGPPEGVSVELQGDITPVVWPMLHTDDNTVGEYEFGTVEGADAPVAVDGNVVTFPINIAPALTLNDQPLTMGDDGASVVIAAAAIDAPGFIAIHNSTDGAPGPVIAQTFIRPGVNRNVAIPVDAAAAGAQVFPMLHYDTGEPGVYEFGTVEGADGPVTVAGAVVVAPLNILPAEAPAEDDTAASGCTVSPSGSASVRMRASSSRRVVAMSIVVIDARFEIGGPMSTGRSVTEYTRTHRPAPGTRFATWPASSILPDV